MREVFPEPDPRLDEFKDQATYLGVSPQEAVEDAMILNDPRVQASIAEMEDGILIDITPDS